MVSLKNYYWVGYITINKWTGCPIHILETDCNGRWVGYGHAVVVTVLFSLQIDARYDFFIYNNISC